VRMTERRRARVCRSCSNALGSASVSSAIA
jgi:hypothetical protein